MDKIFLLGSGKMAETLIELIDITKKYMQGNEEINALDGVSVKIRKGEFVAIIGASGSGKSTLLNMLGCLDSFSEGRYFLDGVDVNSLNDNELSYIRNKKIGFIFQGFNLIQGMTALENVELPLIYRKVPKDERKILSEQALGKVSLSHRMKHKPNEMSGGQQQRVAIARAIAANPPIILSDEPTGNLDKRSGEEVMEILKNLNNSGITVIIITHDSEIAEKAKRKIRISDGRIVEDVIK